MSTGYYKTARKFRSKNYEKGARFEYAAMKYLRNRGWHVMRRFGSIGVYFCPRCLQEMKRPPKGGKSFCPKCKIEGVKASLDITAYKNGQYLMISCKFRSDRPSVYMDDATWQNMVLYASKFGATPLFCGVTLDRKMYFIDLRTLMNFDLFHRIKPLTMDFVAGFFDADGSVSFKKRKKSWDITFYNTNKKVLDEIRDFLKAGRVYKVKGGVKQQYQLFIGRHKAVKRIGEQLLQLCIIKAAKLERAVNYIDNREFAYALPDVYYRHKKGQEPEQTDINRLIAESWSIIDLANEFVGEKAEDKCKSCKMKAKWAEVKIKMVNILNRVLWRAGKTEHGDDLTKLFEEEELEPEPEKGKKNARSQV